MKKKVLSLLLTLCLVMTFLPMAAFAEDAQNIFLAEQSLNQGDDERSRIAVYDVDLLHDIQFKRPFKDSIEDQKHDMHPDRYAHRVQESCANLRRIIDLKCVENNTRHDQIHENYGQNLAV